MVFLLVGLILGFVASGVATLPLILFVAIAGLLVRFALVAGGAGVLRQEVWLALGATVAIAEAWVRPPDSFMDRRVGSFSEDPTLAEVLQQANVYCYQCDDLLDERIPMPLARDLRRREVVFFVEEALPLDFRLGLCGTGVSMRVPAHPIFADFVPRQH